MELSYLRKHRKAVSDIIHLLKENKTQLAIKRTVELDQNLAFAIHSNFLSGDVRYKLVLQVLALMTPTKDMKTILSTQHYLTQYINKKVLAL